MEIKFYVSLIIGMISYHLGGWDVMLQALITLTIVDYITGLLAGMYQGRLSSKIGYKGIIKKTMMFFVIMVANQIGCTLGNDIIRNITITFYIFNEAISILENVTKTGAKVPKQLEKILCELNKKDCD